MEKAETHRSILADIAIIKKVDLVIIGKPLNYRESAGCVWEWEISRLFQKEWVTSDYLLGKSPEPHLWAVERKPNSPF